MLRRLPRVLLNVLTALSLLLCVALCVLWARSNTYSDRWTVAAAGGRLWSVGSVHDYIHLETVDGWPVDVPLYWQAIDLGTGRPTRPSVPADEGFLYYVGQGGPGGLGLESWQAPHSVVRLVRGRLCTYAAGRPPDSPIVVGPDGAAREAGTGRPVYTAALTYHEVAVPSGLACAATGAAPLTWLALRLGRRVRSRRRRRLNQCPSCGYDRRATPGRCPECGTAPS
jgi:hypothetical protein